MIKNIIFDFGAVLIPLAEYKTWQAFEKLGAKDELKDQKEIFHDYETGRTDTQEFLKNIQPFFFRTKIFPGDLAKAWNAMLISPLPEENISFLKKTKKHHRIFLLSNTNDLHITAIKDAAGRFSYKQFTKQFEKVYYSYEVGMRKPNEEIFQKVLSENDLKPEETLYIEDGAKNIRAASKLNIETWHFDPELDSILDLDTVLSKHH